ncbi:MAG: hypothetical protein IIZ53_06565 [Ruminococcus sp.]|nr:hypothetical protein [Ruminococcus sp.]
MKKTIAVIAAFTLAVCSLAGCSGHGSDTSGSSSSSSSSSSALPHNISVEFNRENAEKISEEHIGNYFELINKGDIEGSLKYQYDAENVEAAAVMSGYASSGDSAAVAVEKMIDGFKQSYSGHTLELEKIKDVKAITEEGYVLLDEMYGRVCEVNKLIEGCRDSLDTERISEEYQKIDDVSSYRREYEEGYDVIADVSVDGKAEEQEMFVYRAVGGNWQIDMTVPSYLQSTEEDVLNNTASSAANAASETLNEMAASGKNINGRFIVGSDSSHDYNIPSTFDIDTFRSKYAEKYTGAPDADYFIVIDSSYGVYSVYRTSEGKQGIYPFGVIIKDDGSAKLTYEELKAGKEYSFDELFDMCRDIIG